MSGEMVVRWKFTDLDTSETVTLPINPREMSSPTMGRSMNWAWGTRAGINRIRGFDMAVDSPTQWTFTGVILSEDHYNLLLDWTKRLHTVRIDDHLGRAFKVIIQNYAPVERLPTALLPWRADYTMTCLLLGEL